MYSEHYFHEDCFEGALARTTYGADVQDDESTNCSEKDSTGTVIGEGGDPQPMQLSSHYREYSAYPSQTRLEYGRPSIIIDPGSVGNLCGDKWAKEVAHMAKANGRKPAHRLRERALQVSGVGNGSQQCHYDCALPVAIRPVGGQKLQDAVLNIPAVQDSDLPGLMGLTALKNKRAILDSNTLTLYFCGSLNYDLDKSLPSDTDRYKLETALAGHLVLPCCEYKSGGVSQD